MHCRVKGYRWVSWGQTVVTLLRNDLFTHNWLEDHLTKVQNIVGVKGQAGEIRVQPEGNCFKMPKDTKCSSIYSLWRYRYSS